MQPYRRKQVHIFEGEGSNIFIFPSYTVIFLNIPRIRYNESKLARRRRKQCILKRDLKKNLKVFNNGMFAFSSCYRKWQTRSSSVDSFRCCFIVVACQPRRPAPAGLPGPLHCTLRWRRRERDRHSFGRVAENGDHGQCGHPLL